MPQNRSPRAEINFCHISPTKHLDIYTKDNGAHLLLAHLVEEDPEYRDYYANLNDGRYKIMDNSAFEMFKLGRPMYESSKLIEMGKACGANCIVLSDYPKEPASKTIEAAKKLIPEFKAAGFDTFFVPQSEVGDMVDYINAYEWALNNDDVDLIGVSILGAPIACGVNESTFEDGRRDDAYKMQRYLSRLHVFRELEKRNLLTTKAVKRFHCLGMVDGPNEIDLLREYHQFIFSWDSSAAVWAGINGIRFDNSPTGLRTGKFEKEVDFGYNSDHMWGDTFYNIEYINQLVWRKK
jgi:hypothetical protein